MTAASIPRSNRWHVALSAFWFGNFFLYQPLTTVVIQGQVDALVPKDSQNTDIGIVIGVGGFLAMAVPPTVGALSDRLTTRWGRRRPIMVVGTLLALPGLLILANATNFIELVVGYAVVQFFFNAAGAAFAGIIPDVVPAQEFGKASGFLAAMVQLGSGAGLGAAYFLAGNRLLIYLAFSIVMVLTLLPTYWAARDEGLIPVPRGAGRPLGEAVIDFIRPLLGGDFGWVIYTRFMVSAAISAVAYFLHNFFADVTGVSNTDQFTAVWFLVVLAAAVPLGLAGGYFSDRLQRRKVFVYLSGGFQAVVALVFVLVYPTAIPLIFVLGIAYGVGYGLYYSVDWALACDTLPVRTQAAKDMGLFHIALTLPQFLFLYPLGKLLDYFNGQSHNSGYRLLFIFAILFLALGTVLVGRIRSVR